MSQNLQVQLKFDDAKKFEDFNIKLERLSLITGMNGTGKSLMNQVIWYLNFCLQIYQTLMLIKYPNIEEEVEKYLKELPGLIWDFNSCQMFVRIESEEFNCDISYIKEIDQEPEVKFNIDWRKTISLQQVIYLSSSHRNFNELKKFKEMKELLGIKQLQDIEDLKKLCKFYKAYDIMSLATLNEKMDFLIREEIPRTHFLESVNSRLKELNNFPEIIFDSSAKELKAKVNGRLVELNHLSTGEQNILFMMFTASNIKVQS